MSSSGDDDIIYIESEEDNLYSEDDCIDSSKYGLAEEELTSKKSQLSYVVLKGEDIRKHQRDIIQQVSSVLSVSQAESVALLLHYRWSVGKVEEDWFTDEEKVRKSVGISKEHVVDDHGDGNNSGSEVKIDCGICFDSYAQNKILTVSCGHPYCNTCWTGYITCQINDGPGCLMVKCPEPSCSAVVGQDLIEKVTKEEDKEKYYRFLLRSYVEGNRKHIKWCLSPGCEYAIEFRGESENYDVTCLCSNIFFWNCNGESHRPLDCETVSKWVLKNKDESENMNWILVNTKSCPKCKRQIEKNQGCNHMTCSLPCGTHFCWLCLAPLTDHRTCNQFKPGDEAEIKRERAKNAIDKYTHYYERWASNQSSRQMAITDLNKFQSVQLKVVSNKQNIPETQLQFTIEAWLQIIECRRVLKWTYAYGYYIPEHELAKRQFFEYLQGEAEVALERLHYCAEKELNQFVNKGEVPQQKFEVIRTKLIDLTKVTKTYFENLVKAWENGLVDVGYTESQSTTDYLSPNKKQKMVGRVIGGSKRL